MICGGVVKNNICGAPIKREIEQEKANMALFGHCSVLLA
jgi:hypothetical protein